MKKSILGLERVVVLSKNEQKKTIGGRGINCSSFTTELACSAAGCQWFTGRISYCYQGVPHIAP